MTAPANLTLRHIGRDGTTTYLAATSIAITGDHLDGFSLSAEIGGGPRREAHDGWAHIINAVGVTIDIIRLDPEPIETPAEEESHADDIDA